MTIGEQLKKVRRSLNLTQTEMCAGVVTESFYSRVENGKSEINIDDLIAILKQNHVSVRDFFNVFDQSMPRSFQYRCILSAINNRDVTWLKKEQKDKPIFKAELTAVIATLTNKDANLSDTARRKIKSNFGRLGKWDEAALWNLASFMSLYDVSELKLLITDIYENKNSIGLTDSSVLTALANVMVGYLGRMYQEKDLDSVLQTIEFIEKMPANPIIMFHKLIAIYYLVLINHDQKQLDLIIKVLQKNSYDNYLACLPQR